MISQPGIETGLSGEATSYGVWDVLKYGIPVIGPILSLHDLFWHVMGIDTTASQGFFDYTKAYIKANPKGFTEDQIYNLAVSIGTFYTDIQRKRDLTPTEESQMIELSGLADQLVAVIVTAPRVVPKSPDYGPPLIPPVPDLNPFSGIGAALEKYKWVFIGAGALLTFNIFMPLITAAVARGKK